MGRFVDHLRKGWLKAGVEWTDEHSEAEAMRPLKASVRLGETLDSLVHGPASFPEETLHQIARLGETGEGEDLPFAYYRTVLDHLTPDALDPGYVEYVARKYETLFGNEANRTNQGAVSRSQNRAVLDRR